MSKSDKVADFGDKICANILNWRESFGEAIPLRREARQVIQEQSGAGT
ncbi:MAG TPA: hypothetical protein VL101_06285 [Nordella sp.]|nr:hypothetical protein [Nordella sp.]